MQFFGVVVGFCGERMVNPNSVVEVIAQLRFSEAMLIFVKVEHHISKSAIVHFPPSFTQWCCNRSRENSYKILLIIMDDNKPWMTNEEPLRKSP